MTEAGEATGSSEEKEGKSDVERCEKANEAYCEECEKQGLKVCTLDDLPARQEFMAGRIDEAQLKTKAAAEVSEHAKTFGKYLVVQDQKPGIGDEGASMRERAKLANKIYKQVCQEEGLTACFFSDFSSWSEYVKGELADLELYGRAKAEIERIASGQ